MPAQPRLPVRHCWQRENPTSFLSAKKRKSDERGPRAGGPPFRGDWGLPLPWRLGLSIFSARPIKAAYSVFLRVDSKSRFCSHRSPIFSSEPSHQPRSHVARHAGSRICATPTTTMSHRLAGGTRTKFTNAESIVSQVFDHQSVCRLLRVTVPVPKFGSNDHTVP